jgi:hypothetical protein
MKTYEAIPLHGVGPVALGMARSQVHGQLSTCTSSFHKVPVSAQPADAWYNNAFQVFYDPNETVEYIELSRTKDFSVACLGVSVFNTPVISLIEHFMQFSAVDTSDPEYGYSFIFASLELSLWRPVREGSEATYFSAIGVGRRGYYGNAA